MSSARTEILTRLKTALKSTARQTEPPLIPARGLVKGQACIDAFVEEAIYGLAEVVRLKVVTEIPKALTKILNDAETTKLKAAPHADLQSLDWSGVDVEFGRGEADDLVALSVAFAGVAETGTLVMRSGVDAPTTLNFLPDVHVVVMYAGDIEGNYEAVWQRLKTENKMLPRTVNWITGPSRTADIEQTMLLGAHGPRKLVILLINEKA